MPKRLKSIVAGGISLVLLAGCSSTAQVNGDVDPDVAMVEEVAAPQTLESLPPSASTTGIGRKDPTIAAVPEAAEIALRSAESAFVASAPPSPTTVPRTAMDHGPGVTDRVIRIGAPLIGQEPELFDTLGYDETLRPDFARVWRIVTRAINANGGILGRRLEVVLLPGEPSAEQVCTRFTEEVPVIAVIGHETGAASCLSRAGTASISHTYALEPEDYRRVPHLVAPLGITLQRANRLYIDGLYQQGFFDGDHKIGIIRWDTPGYASLSNKVVRPALARYGLEVEEEVAIHNPETDEQIAQSLAEGWSSVQTFKDAGVDRMLTLDVATYILPHFTKFAKQQEYHPRYGLNSLNGGEWELERDQLEGAMGIGWMPWLDLEPRDAYRHGSEGARRCKDLMVAAGASEEMDTYNEGIWTSSICDGALLLKAAIEAGGPNITADSIVAGVETLGTSFQASNTLMTRFGPGRHEGPAAIRLLRWFTGCQCFRYTSDLFDAG